MCIQSNERERENEIAMRCEKKSTRAASEQQINFNGREYLKFTEVAVFTRKQETRERNKRKIEKLIQFIYSAVENCDIINLFV
jgi:hypothetical protein